MKLDRIVPLILTYNESPNLDRMLQKLAWAKQIVAIDSYSTDETIDILKSYPQIQIYQRKFDTHATQWNYGLAQIEAEWILSLDADYILTDSLIAEIESLSNSAIDGYYIPFKYCVFGKPLRSTILPPRQSLFRREKSIYIDDGHTQLLQITGESSHLSNYIYHDDRKSLSRWLWAQDRYLIIEAEKLLTTPNDRLSVSDRLRKQKFIAPWIILFYCLFFRGGILDGWHGCYYAFQRTLVELLLSIHLIEAQYVKPLRSD